MRPAHLTALKSIGTLGMIAICMALVPASVFAQDAIKNLKIIGESGFNAPVEGDPQIDLINSVAIIIDSVLGLMGIILVTLMVYAGFLWMTAGGSEEKVGKAKTLIKNAVIGLVIILSAYTITAFVVNAVLSGAGVQPPAAAPPG